MAVDLKSPGLDRLSVEDRLALVEQFRESQSSSSAELPLTQAQCDELDRRLADHHANPEEGVSGDDLKQSLDARFSR